MLCTWTSIISIITLTAILHNDCDLQAEAIILHSLLVYLRFFQAYTYICMYLYIDKTYIRILDSY